uniref:CST complex subunit STN1 n=1 Tax=Leptobrachium leishanense TaxID=445787 RepID=A0A8C5WIN1_9ANUR
MPRSMEEIPSVLWGLDPVFLTFARLYVKDILEIKESYQVPGIFFYNKHPIKQVDILGTIVYVREKDSFYTYGGNAILLFVWPHQSTSGSKGLDEMMQDLYREEAQKAKMEIGDVIRVRGYIKVFRSQREIVASNFFKVDDPMLDLQIARMLDLPFLYRNVYDKPFSIPEHMKDPSQQSARISLLAEKIKVFLAEDKIQNFYQRELESVASLLTIARDPGSSATGCTTKEIHSTFKEAINLLLKQGIVFQRGNRQDVYQVTDHDKELHKLTLTIIQEDGKRHRHAEKGCNFLHILQCVRQSFDPNMTDVVLRRVVGALENNSDIVSTMENYYITF